MSCVRSYSEMAWRGSYTATIVIKFDRKGDPRTDGVIVEEGHSTISSSTIKMMVTYHRVGRVYIVISRDGQDTP